MKRGYIRLLILEIIILILNGFVSSILNKNLIALFLLGTLVIFKIFFGFEKDHHRYWKLMCVEILMYVLIYFLLYYLSGLIISFAKTHYNLSFSLIIKEVIPLILTIILGEILRYMMLMKSEGSKLLLICTCLLFVFLELSNYYNKETFTSIYSVFIFIAVYLLPILSNNIFCSYTSYKTGYKPVIMYLLITKLYIYFVPIVPNPNEYLFAVLGLVVPMIYLYYVYSFYKQDRDEDIIKEKQENKFLTLILPTIITIILVYFTSGFFYYHAIAVGSGSMSPKIKKGDVVVIEKERDFDKLKEGEVIAFKHGKIIVIHRLVKKIKLEDKYYFYTKGDANEKEDNFQITEDMYMGIVKVRIPIIGYPTVWLNKL